MSKSQLNRSFDQLFNSIFEPVVNQVTTSTKYPPFNIYSTEDRLYVDLAVAGFKRDNLHVTIHNRVITVEGKFEPMDKDVIFTHKGISQKSFKLNFPMSAKMSLDVVELIDGILRLTFKDSAIVDTPVSVQII